MRVTFDYGVTCVIMGGGQGSRLFPLTKDRAKPAVPLGTKYRLIDIPLSNCINSGLNRIFILTQFNSNSLHRHIHMAYHFDRFSKGFVEILAAQQTPLYDLRSSWYQGTADAVRKNLPRLREAASDDGEILILSGDQIYQMDFREVLSTHRGEDGSGAAPVTIAALLVTRERARQLGVLETDAQGNVVRFVEKPGHNDALLDSLQAPDSLVEKFGLSPEEGPWFLANMGIYVFQSEVLCEALEIPFTDFGKEVLPAIAKSRKMRVHLFLGYWEDIGTISSFLQATLDLAAERPQFDFYSIPHPVYTRARLLPATRITSLSASRALIADGCRVESAVLENCLLGIRSVVGKDVELRNTYVMGCDYYEDPSRSSGSLPPVGIGDGCSIQNAIIDKNCRIGRNVRIRNAAEHQEYEDGYVYIRDGIVIVPRNGSLPDGYSI
jgi:glucose-1-phosphate adenylyltransferase